jgi:uncharacterized protein (DUF58 family)
VAAAAPAAKKSVDEADRSRRSRVRLRAPRRLRFTREGKIFIGVTLGVGFAAINTGNNLLYLVLGLLLSLIVLSGILSEIALRGLEFRRRLPRRSFAGTPMSVEIEVRNKKKYAPSYSIEVEDRLANRRTDKRCYFLKVSAGARQTAQYRRTPPVRGMERYVALRVATRFPFGLFEKWREVDLVEEQLVYPSPVRAARPAIPSQSMGDAMTRDGRGSGEVDGVRDIRDDEPARDVHWRKTAATGRLVGRERKRELARRLQLEVRNRPASNDAGSSERIEDELRRIAWIALDALKDGVAVELRAQDGGSGQPSVLRAPPSPASPDRVLAFLARLPPDAATAESA